MHLWAASLIVLLGCSAPAAPARASGPAAADPWAAPPRASSAPAVEQAPPPSPQGAQVSPQPPQPLTPTPAPVVACPDRSSSPQSAPPLTTRLVVWRSRAELPACLEPHVPIDFDFSREMLAADLPTSVQLVTIKSPTRPPVRKQGTLTVEEDAPFVDCPPCRGVADDTAPERLAVPPLTLWRLPAMSSVVVLYRMKPHPMTRPCPPPTCA